MNSIPWIRACQTINSVSNLNRNVRSANRYSLLSYSRLLVHVIAKTNSKLEMMTHSTGNDESSAMIHPIWMIQPSRSAALSEVLILKIFDKEIRSKEQGVEHRRTFALTGRIPLQIMRLKLEQRFVERILHFPKRTHTSRSWRLHDESYLNSKDRVSII